MKKTLQTQGSDADFAQVVCLIGDARQKANRTVNAQLIDLYWAVGEYVSKKIVVSAWGKGTVSSLADYIKVRQPGQRGFSAQNIWRMRQFYDAYCEMPILSTLLRELAWSSHLHILSRSKLAEEREFYLRMAKQEQWQVREVARQMDAQLFARAVLQPPKLSTVLRESQPKAEQVFKDSYFLEFLGLQQDHTELDLHQSLLNHLGRFLTELGSDFCFIGSEFPLQVGGKDFALDLLFYHRGLNCLVAIELKITEFEPEHLGKLNFYLEALDRDHRKAHENPAIGVLLCASKDDEVVEYALSRSLSPAMIAEYQTQLPDKKLLQEKLHEFYQSAEEYYTHAISAKLRENNVIRQQIANHNPAEAMPSGFQKAVDDAITDSGEAYRKLAMQLKSDPGKAAMFSKVIFDILTGADGRDA